MPLKASAPRLWPPRMRPVLVSTSTKGATVRVRQAGSAARAASHRQGAASVAIANFRRPRRLKEWAITFGLCIHVTAITTQIKAAWWQPLGGLSSGFIANALRVTSDRTPPVRTALFQLDAFASRLFAGNPAAVMPLETFPSDAVLQAVAAENNLAETAFLVRQGDDYRIRWFTPTIEVALCGHATLA